jgi:hypothetical protein
MLKFISNLSQSHYPERASVIAVVNAPSWFSIFFRLIKPLINENTQKKIRVYGAKETLDGLLEFMELDRIPEMYGGTYKAKDKHGNPVAPTFGTESELAVGEYTRRLNSGSLLPRPPHFEREDVSESMDKEGRWEGDPADALCWSDAHLPLDEQKSNFARSVRGLPLAGGGSTGGGLGEEVRKRDNDSSSEDGEIVKAITSAKRPNHDEDGGSGIIRKDSTLVLNFDSDSESGYDSEERGGSKEGFSGERSASASSDAYGFFAPDPNAPKIKNIIHEGWIYKKATGEGWLGRRNWAPRWAKLVEADMPNGENIGRGNVLLLVMYWYETSVSPSSWVFLNNCVTVPLDRQAEDWNSYCFDCVHLPAVRQTRSFSALSANHRDEWVSVINKTLSQRKEKEIGDSAVKKGDDKETGEK